MRIRISARGGRAHAPDEEPGIDYRVLTAYPFRGGDHTHELLPGGHAGRNRETQ